MAAYSDLFEWVRPKAGAIAFIKFKGPMTSEEFGAQLAEAGIGIKPAYCFTDRVTDEIDYFRIVSSAQSVCFSMFQLADRTIWTGANDYVHGCIPEKIFWCLAWPLFVYQLIRMVQFAYM